MWDFKTLFLLNMLGFTVAFLAEYLFLRILTQARVRQRFLWLLYPAVGAILSFVYTKMTMPDILRQGHFVYTSKFVLLDIGILFIDVFLHHYLFPTLGRRLIFFLNTLAGMIFAIVNHCYTLIRYDLFAAIVFEFEASASFYLLKNLFCLGVLALVLLVISKTKLMYIVSKAFLRPNIGLVAAALIMGMQFVLSMPLVYEKVGETASLVISWGRYGVVLLFLIFLFRECLQEERVKNAEALVLQQNVYLERLEGVQQELRKIHHDHKNVATGLYAQVAAGDVAAAQEYISRQMLQMDQGLQVSIQQLNQLTNIHVIELKTLIMTKIMEAEKQDVKLVVEVLAKVASVPMEIVDLLRCGGILLDNAIEAAAQEREKKVTVVLLKEQEQLTFAVKNSFSQAVDLQLIWQEGYSTKGASRGLGLANLQEITRRYRNVWLETRQEEDMFVQILNFSLA